MQECKPVNATQIRKWIDTDLVSSRVRRNLLSGWSDSDDPKLQAYQSCVTELSVQDGCIFRGSWVIIPQEEREAAIAFVLEGYPGETCMKHLGRVYVWWPGIDNVLELAVKTCPECRENQSSLTRAPMHLWKWPDRPWIRVHFMPGRSRTRWS